MGTSMISMNQSQLIIVGGEFKQEIAPIHHTKNLIDLLQEQVAHSAFHNSAQRIDAPRCHPDTRRRVKEGTSRWVRCLDPITRNMSIMWLSGAAGAGKSAIAQSLAENLFSQHLLLASFFFSRSDPTRNHVGQLISTLVYQIYLSLPDSAGIAILQAVDKDRLIWTRDIFTQFEGLIIRPLRTLIQSGFFDNMESPRVIIIDGLDECTDRNMQRMVLKLFFRAREEWKLPFLFLVASRHELEIAAVFAAHKRTPIHFRVNLDVEIDARPDIETFLYDELNRCRDDHPLRQYIPSTWPSEIAIEALVHKSSGKFIYAAVVVKYVTSLRHYPPRRLESILNVQPTADTPFAELDTLYSQVLSSVEDVHLVHRILTVRLLFITFDVSDIDTILQLDAGGTVNALCDLGSLISVVRVVDIFRDMGSDVPMDLGLRMLSSNGDMIWISHASLSDHLFNASRSGVYYIDKISGYHGYLKRFIDFLNNTALDHRHLLLIIKICAAFPQCFYHIKMNDEIREIIVASFCVASVYRKFEELAASKREVIGYPEPITVYRQAFYRIFVTQGLPNILAALYPSSSNHDNKVRQHLLSGIYDVFAQRLILEPRTIELDFNLALLSLVNTPRCLPPGAFNAELRIGPPSSQVLHAEPHMFSEEFLTDRYLKLLTDWLSSYSDNSTPITNTVFSNAAIFCLEYVCTRGRYSTTLKSPLSGRIEMRRILPWTWRHKPLRNRLEPLSKTPWMWLPKRFGVHPSPLCNSMYQHSPFYAFLPRQSFYRTVKGGYAPSPGNCPSASRLALDHRVDSEKYWLALHYLTLFLPRASHSSTLIDICKSRIFKSSEYGRKARQARSAMKQYLARWGVPLY